MYNIIYDLVLRPMFYHTTFLETHTHTKLLVRDMNYSPLPHGHISRTTTDRGNGNFTIIIVDILCLRNRKCRFLIIYYY